MKVWVMAGAFAAFAFPTVAAADVTSPCRTDDTRGVLSTDRVEATSAPASQTSARQSTAQRETQEARVEPQRRRSGKRVPDAELIGPRGAL